MGLGAGDPPELWNIDHPERVRTLHQQFVDAGADIILTNTFGCNRHRLKLHGAEDRVYELAKRAAELACEVADAAPRPVVVAGSIGPTGELFEPLGALTEDDARSTSFAELAAGLQGRWRRRRLDRDDVGRRRDPRRGDGRGRTPACRTPRPARSTPPGAR